MRYLIWSIEHQAWWNPNRHGYTVDPCAAGAYSKDEAEQIVEEANRFSFEEVMIPVPAVHGEELW